MTEKTMSHQHLIKGWEIVIGLEVHAQITSQSKLFSGASATYGGAPNTHVSLVDAAFPGMLPVLNHFCVEQAVRTGLGLNAHINLLSRFDRKNYFYPDLPQGYQISQFTSPVVGEGYVEVEDEAAGSFVVNIERLHLEQDAGKSIHDLDPKASYVDLNRCGVALMEIVTRPDMRSGEQAAAFVKKLRAILRALGTCDGNMEEGSMRADVNVSVRKPGADLGTRCEIKNVNSMRFMMQAIAYEAHRQIALLEEGGEVQQETRLFDATSGETRAMRSKEEAHDYRYFPDPDLLPLRLDADWVQSLRASLPELPDARKKRFMTEYGLSAYDAALLCAEAETASFFEHLAQNRNPKQAANWITGPLFGALNKAGLSLKDTPVDVKSLGALLDLLDKGVISGRGARDVFDIMFEKGGTPEEIVRREGLEQVSDLAELEAIIETIIAENPKQVEQVKAKPKTLGWFVGQVMQKTGGKANPQSVNELLQDKLDLKDG